MRRLSFFIGLYLKRILHVKDTLFIIFIISFSDGLQCFLQYVFFTVLTLMPFFCNADIFFFYDPHSKLQKSSRVVGGCTVVYHPSDDTFSSISRFCRRCHNILWILRHTSAYYLWMLRCRNRSMHFRLTSVYRNDLAASALMKRN